MMRIPNWLERSRLMRNLAGVDARRAFTQDLSQLLSLAERYNQPLCLVVLDIDDFQHIHDCYGSSISNHVLNCFSELLRSSFRSKDAIARWSDAQFVMGLYDATQDDVVVRLAGILRFIQQQPFTADSTTLMITFSAGVAEYPRDGITLQSLYQSASAALDRAKAAGTSRILTAR